MKRYLVILYFYTLAITAFFLLWGVSLLNGTVKALLLAVWNGKLNEEVDLKTNYTGTPLLDYPLAVLVTFFFYGTNGHDKHYQLFLLDAYSTLQSAFVWLYAETTRPGRKPKWIERPILFGILWQCFGAAFSLPLYYATHIAWYNQLEVSRAKRADTARSIPFGFLLGAVFPAVIGLAPVWYGPELRSAATHQDVLAAWQPDPVWVALIQNGFLNVISFMGINLRRDDERHTAYKWIRISYLLAAVSSALGHLYAVAATLTGDAPVKSLVRMYVPFPTAGPAGVTDILVGGPWLFLQYDLIIISLSSLSWAFIMLAKASRRQDSSNCRLLLLMLVGFMSIGPGATVSLALFAREKMLPVDSKASG